MIHTIIYYEVENTKYYLEETFFLSLQNAMNFVNTHRDKEHLVIHKRYIEFKDEAE